jgi:hypothetical protein
MSSHATKFGVLISSNWDEFKDISRKSGATGQKEAQI